jgi:hypothetical protein
MNTGDLAVYIPENLLCTIVETDYKVEGRHKVHPTNSKDKKEFRILPADKLRLATDDDLDHIEYLYTDEETGQVVSMKLRKAYVEAIPRYLSIGKSLVVTTKDILTQINEPDSDGTRRQFRAAVAWWIEKGIIICSTNSGYFVADNSKEVQDCVTNKERQAEGNLRRARLLKSMDVDASKLAFLALTNQEG